MPRKPEKVDQALAARIAAAVDHCGKSQAQIAKEVNISEGHLSNIVTGNDTVGRDTLRRIAVAVDERLDHLEGLDELGKKKLSEKLTQLYEKLGRDRLDMLDELDADEVREWADEFELRRARRLRRKKTDTESDG